jgi:hypothetical protein
MVEQELRHLSPELQHSMQVVVAAAQSPELLELVEVASAVLVALEGLPMEELELQTQEAVEVERLKLVGFKKPVETAVLAL